jgi:hypothetical protein
MSMPLDAVDFPFDLPNNFLWFLGCPDNGRYVGIFFDGDCLGYNNGAGEAVGTLDEWKLIDLIEELHVDSWLIDRSIELRDAEHWIVVDRDTNHAMIVSRELGLRITSKQEVDFD